MNEPYECSDLDLVSALGAFGVSIDDFDSEDDARDFIAEESSLELPS